MTIVCEYTTQDDQNHGIGFYYHAWCLFPHALHVSALVWAGNLSGPLALGLQQPLVPVAEQSSFWGQIVGLGNHCIAWDQAW